MITNETLEAMMTKLLEKHLVAIKGELTKNKDDINKTMKKFSDKLDVVSDRQKVTDQSVEQIKVRLDTVETVLTDIENAGLSSHSNDLAVEIMERQIRSKNIIFFGMPESTASTAESRIDDDKSKLNDIFVKLDISLAGLKVYRVGKKSIQTSRPVKVIFKDTASAINFLRQKSKYDGPISFHVDQTQQQRDHLKKLKTELQDLKNDGITNKTIRFFNGVPKIIDIQPSRPTKNGSTANQE